MDNNPPNQTPGEDSPFSPEKLKEKIENPEALDAFLEEEFLAPLLKMRRAFQQAVLIKSKKTPSSDLEALPLDLIAPTISSDLLNKTKQSSTVDTQVTEERLPTPQTSTISTSTGEIPLSVPTHTVLHTRPASPEKNILDELPPLPEKEAAQAPVEEAPSPIEIPEKQESRVEVKDSSDAEKRFLERQKKIEDLLKKDKGTTF